MGLLQELEQALGSDNLKRLQAGQGNFEDKDSPDQNIFQQMIKKFDPKQLQDAFGRAAQKVDSEEYADHVTPGVGGTNPLGEVGKNDLGKIATSLLNRLKEAGAAVGSNQSAVPGVKTTDPKQMSPDEVASMASYAQQNHPEAFGKAATDIGQQQPALLNSFLGK